MSSLNPNAIVKFEADLGCRITIGSGASIVNFGSITFTSLRDDAHGGNTDAVDETPTETDWWGVASYNPTYHWLPDSNILYAEYPTP